MTVNVMQVQPSYQDPTQHSKQGTYSTIPNAKKKKEYEKQGKLKWFYIDEYV